MKKNKLSIIFAILTCISIFSVAAIADQCGCRLVPVEEKIDTQETGEAIEEEATQEEEKGETKEEQEEDAAEEEKETDQETEEEATSEESTAEEEEETQQQIQAEAPTITLEIYEGPTYSSSDDVCYYRIKAIVSGTPAPTVEFSKDDSNGAWGTKKVQININDPSDTYTLTATATNSEGTATDSINLSWGCDIPNSPPVISEIIFMGNHYIGLEYTFSAAASDPDGDSLSYYWSVSGGSIANPNTNPVKWTMPATAGNYDITVTVDDGNGGQSEKTETVEVLAFPSASLSQIPGGGFMEEGGLPSTGNFAVIGDSVFDKPIRGFLNFDISSLAGKELISAEMKFNSYYIQNNPYPLIEKIYLEAVYWGTDDIKQGDYDLSGYLLGEYDIPAFTCSSLELGNALNQAINDGHDRFQVRLRHKGYKTNHDGLADTIEYGHQYPVEFNVSYVP